MRSLFFFCFLGIAAGWCGGCAGQPGTTAVPRVAPLTEPEFDRFANELAERIEAALPQHSEEAPAVIVGPRVARGGPEDAGVANAFAETLADGLNDRLGGVANFSGAGVAEADPAGAAPEAGSAPRLQALVDFGPASAATKRLVTFTLLDEATQRELLRDSLEYEARAAPALAARAPAHSESRTRPPPAEKKAAPAPPASAPAVARGPEPQSKSPPKKSSAARPRSSRTAATDKKSAPKKQKISIDRDERGLATLLAEQAPYLNNQTVAGADGQTIFLSTSAKDRFRLLSQRTVRTTDGRLRVELEFRSRDKKRDADLRLIFLDEEGRQLETTPVLPHRFVPFYTTTTVFTSGSARAARYICLVE